LETGAVLAGKYRLVARLGSGGMGTVWRADHLVLHSPVAVKVLNERAQDSAHGPTRFLREAQAAAALRSPNVVQILDVGMEGAVPFIVMELLEGESLAARLRRVGRLDLATTTQIVTETARALHKAHEAGIVHRDLKPDNIFLVRDVDREIVKVLDFGIAKLVEQMEVEQLTGTGSVLGTPHYMSPEQARGRRDVDHRTDLWALGVIAYECTTGRRPYDSHALGDLLMQICTEDAAPPSSAGGLPAELDAFMVRALARDPAQRFGSALEMAEAFGRLSGVGAVTLPSAPFGAPAGLAAAPSHAPPSHGGYGAPPSGSLPPGSYAGSPSLAPSSATDMGGAGGKGPRVLLLLVGLVFVGALAIAGVAVGIVVYASRSEADASATASPTSAPTPLAQADAATVAEPSAEPPVAPAPRSSPKTAGPGVQPAPAPAPATTTAPTATSKPTGTDAVCASACAKISGCGVACPAGACVGIKLSAAHCINGKKTCLEMASCF
jgi:serine/threonine-protein kinase